MLELLVAPNLHISPNTPRSKPHIVAKRTMRNEAKRGDVPQQPNRSTTPRYCAPLARAYSRRHRLPSERQSDLHSITRRVRHKCNLAAATTAAAAAAANDSAARRRGRRSQKPTLDEAAVGACKRVRWWNGMEHRVTMARHSACRSRSGHGSQLPRHTRPLTRTAIASASTKRHTERERPRWMDNSSSSEQASKRANNKRRKKSERSRERRSAQSRFRCFGVSVFRCFGVSVFRCFARRRSATIAPPLLLCCSFFIVAFINHRNRRSISRSLAARQQRR